MANTVHTHKQETSHYIIMNVITCTFISNRKCICKIFIIYHIQNVNTDDTDTSKSKKKLDMYSIVLYL